MARGPQEFVVQVGEQTLPAWQKTAPGPMTRRGEVAKGLYLVEAPGEKMLEAMWRSVFPRFVMRVAHRLPPPAQGCPADRCASELAHRLECEELHPQRIYGAKPWLRDHVRALQATRGQRSGDPPRGPDLLLLTDEGALLGEARWTLPDPLLAAESPFSLDNRARRRREISRAALKLQEALHLYQGYAPIPEAGSRWLDVGAAPGGATSKLVAQGYEVYAVDRAPLDPRLREHPRVVSHTASALEAPLEEASYGGLFCDINHEAQRTARVVGRFAAACRPEAPVLFNVKIGDWPRWQDTIDRVLALLAASDLKIFEIRHLFHAGDELTVIGQRSPAAV